MAFKEIEREPLTDQELDELAEAVIPGFKRSVKEYQRGNETVETAIDEIMKFL